MLRWEGRKITGQLPQPMIGILLNAPCGQTKVPQPKLQGSNLPRCVSTALSPETLCLWGMLGGVLNPEHRRLFGRSARKLATRAESERICCLTSCKLFRKSRLCWALSTTSAIALAGVGIALASMRFNRQTAVPRLTGDVAFVSVALRIDRGTASQCRA